MSRHPPVRVVLNPVAGGGAGARLRPEIERELRARNVAFEILETRGPDSALQLARDGLQRGVKVIVAAGGDGTVHGVANGILEAGAGSCAMALLPIGTGNDFVKVVPGTRTRTAAYDTIARERIEWYDVGRVRWDGHEEFFVNGMGTGIDVEVVRQLKHLPALPGPLKYLVALIRALLRFEPPALRVGFDGENLERDIMIVAVGNGTCQGGGFYLAPEANPRDGLLDLCLIDRVSLGGIIRVIPKTLRGTQRGDRAVLMRTARRVRLEVADGRPLFFHLDGELREPAGLRVIDVEIMPRLLPVLTGNAE